MGGRVKCGWGERERKRETVKEGSGNTTRREKEKSV